jgi:hypothetical protein
MCFEQKKLSKKGKRGKMGNKKQDRNLIQFLPIVIGVLTEDQIQTLINDFQDLLPLNLSERFQSDAQALIAYLQNKLRIIHTK